MSVGGFGGIYVFIFSVHQSMMFLRATAVPAGTAESAY